MKYAHYLRRGKDGSVFATSFIESMGKHTATAIIENVLKATVSLVANMASHHALVSVSIASNGYLQRDTALAMYDWASKIIMSQSSPRTTMVDLGSRRHGYESLLVVAPGSYIFKYEKAWFYINITKNTTRTDDGNIVDYDLMLTTFKGNKRALDNATREFAPSTAPISDDVQQIIDADPSVGSPVKEAVIVKRRTLDSVIIPEDQKEQIRRRLHMWKHNAQWYYDNGFPHKVSFEFSGPPGTGKTSLAQAIAGELGIPLVTLNMSGISHRDFVPMMFDMLPEKCVVLFDDFDIARVFQARTDKDAGDVIVSDTGGMLKEEALAMILRTLSGPVPLNGKILVFTTNKHHKIDPAILRKGRIDCHLEINPLEDKEIKEFIRLHFKEIVDLDKYTFPVKTGAELTDILYQHPYDVDAFIRAVFE